ncbi:T9SS type B sorting domain-containing protein [Hymenobacter aerophilus]|uniref:T9SS type B sorting domain-containing protein n=1 Tax=Hymenobacter aerophilus TaxID=119644 RepID=UPI0003A29047|nr:gliding motility-associated C-terminal domain-containing protein [Hymenobacter aerophilus]
MHLFLPIIRPLLGLALLLPFLALRPAAAQTLPRQWNRTLGNTGINALDRFRPTTDGGYIVGAHLDPSPGPEVSQPHHGVIDFWVVKLDPQGNRQWDRVLGGSDDEYIAEIRQTTDGGYIVGGWSRSGASGDKTEPSQGGSDYWVVKLDAQGRTQWNRTLGGSSNDELTTLHQTPDGGYLLGGNSSSPVSGDKTAPTVGTGSAPWLIKLDAAGRTQWDLTLPGAKVGSLQALLLTPDGGYLLSGNISVPDPVRPGAANFWAIKLNAAGQPEWERSVGGSESEALRAACTTPDGGYLLGGISYSGASGDKSQGHRGGGDYWVVKLSAAGQLQWEHTYGGSGRDELTSLAPTADGSYLLGGHSDSEVSGEQTQAPLGQADFWLVQIDGAGKPRWDQRFGGSDIEVLTDAFPTKDGGYALGGMSFSGISGDKTQPNIGTMNTPNIWLLKLGVGPPEVSLPAVEAVCAGREVTLVPRINSITAPLAYRWNTGATTPTLSVAQPGTYTVTVTFPGQLSATAQRQVLPFTPNLRISGDSVLCGGAPLTLQAQDAAALAFRWSTGATTGTLAVTQPGTYSVTATYAGGCTATVTQTVRAVAPLPPFTPDSDTTICQGQTLRLQAPPVAGAATYRWSDGSAGPTLLVQQPGDYSVQITTACESVSARHRVSAAPCLTIPNIITPNGDRQNQYFVIQGLSGNNWELVIYSRWGKQVYATKSYRHEWGPEAAPGTYFYTLRQAASGLSYKGWLQVVR